MEGVLRFSDEYEMQKDGYEKIYMPILNYEEMFGKKHRAHSEVFI